MNRRPEQKLFQIRHEDGQQAHEKMLKVANHQEDANLNHNENTKQCKLKTLV